MRLQLEPSPGPGVVSCGGGGSTSITRGGFFGRRGRGPLGATAAWIRRQARACWRLVGA